MRSGANPERPTTLVARLPLESDRPVWCGSRRAALIPPVRDLTQ
jgi:hypothetical protein